MNTDLQTFFKDIGNIAKDNKNSIDFITEVTARRLHKNNLEFIRLFKEGDPQSKVERNITKQLLFGLLDGILLKS